MVRSLFSSFLCVHVVRRAACFGKRKALCEVSFHLNYERWNLQGQVPGCRASCRVGGYYSY